MLSRATLFRRVRWLALGLLVAVALPWVGAADEPTVPGSIAALKGHAEPVYSLAFSPDNKQVVTSSFDRTVKVWDAASGKEIKSLGGSQGHQNIILTVSVNADGTLIATGSSDNTAKVWDYPTSKH